MKFHSYLMLISSIYLANSAIVPTEDYSNKVSALETGSRGIGNFFNLRLKLQKGVNKNDLISQKTLSQFCNLFDVLQEQQLETKITWMCCF